MLPPPKPPATSRRNSKNNSNQWLWQDDERRERLVRKYNDEFNHTRLRSSSGEHLTLPGASPAIALARASEGQCLAHSAEPNCLLAQVVGSGKTMILCAAAMELRRPGPGAQAPYRRAQSHARPVRL
jgi:N12 class adenine-specific DNA methylase